MVEAGNILFNPLKHHLEEIKNFISSNTSQGQNHIHKELKKIGGSQMDLYFGPLPVDEIIQQALHLLFIHNIRTKHDFNSWVEKNKGFQALSLSDSSLWIFRSGNHPEKFVHIHPGRYSAFTTRIKASMLKTAIATILYQRQQKKSLDENLVNEARKTLVGLPPVLLKRHMPKLFQLIEELAN